MRACLGLQRINSVCVCAQGGAGGSAYRHLSLSEEPPPDCLKGLALGKVCFVQCMLLPAVNRTTKSHVEKSLPPEGRWRAQMLQCMCCAIAVHTQCALQAESSRHAAQLLLVGDAAVLWCIPAGLRLCCLK